MYTCLHAVMGAGPSSGSRAPTCKGLDHLVDTGSYCTGDAFAVRAFFCSTKWSRTSLSSKAVIYAVLSVGKCI